MNAIRIIGAATLLCAGCGPQASNSQTASTAPLPEQGVAVNKQVTLYLEGMNERLQIL